MPRDAGPGRVVVTTPDPRVEQFAGEQAWVAERLGPDYTVVNLLGRGAAGSVYLARERVLWRHVAVKVLHGHLATDRKTRDQFLTEARASATLAHPCIVPLHTVVTGENFAASVMQYVPGPSLARLLESGTPMPASEVCRILAELSSALHYAHRQRVVHRDVKPENVILHRDTGIPMLTDFGVARTVSLDAMSVTQQRAERDHLYGTPTYMSPEQILGQTELDGRSDLYALGVLGYAMLVGRPPFEGPDLVAMTAMHLTQAPPPLGPRAPGAPGFLVETIMRCLEKHPDDRWRDGLALRRALIDEKVPRLAFRARMRAKLRALLAPGRA